MRNLILLSLLFLASCGGDDKVDRELVGTWIVQEPPEGKGTLFTFEEDGTGSIYFQGERHPFEWRRENDQVMGDTISMVGDDVSLNGPYRIRGGTLTIEEQVNKMIMVMRKQ